MKKTMRTLALTLVFASSSVWAFIPPVGNILADVFEGRQAARSTEFNWRHRVKISDTEVVDIDEKIFSDRNRLFFIWRFPTLGAVVIGSLDGLTYNVIGQSHIPSRSRLFLKYLFASVGEEFRDALISEQFLRTDQLLQFKPGYQPTGDPTTWPTKDNYLLHDDVFLTPLKSGMGITVVGYSSRDTLRSVSFDKSLKGVRKIEWKDGVETASWNFSLFAKMPPKGWVPRAASFESNGVERVSSDITAVRALNDKQLAETIQTWKAQAHHNSLPPSVGASLKQLLGYR